MPEGNKIWVLGDGVGSYRPATNFPRISVDSNRVDCLVEKGDLGVDLRRLVSLIEQVNTVQRATNVHNLAHHGANQRIIVFRRVICSQPASTSLTTPLPSPVPTPRCLPDGGVDKTKEAPSFEGASFIFGAGQKRAPSVVSENASLS